MASPLRRFMPYRCYAESSTIPRVRAVGDHAQRGEESRERHGVLPVEPSL